MTKDFSDMLSITYWPLFEDFTVMPTAIEDVENNIAALLTAAENKPVVIKEAGLPTSAVTNSSEKLQAQFIEELFRQTMHVDRVEIVGWDFLADFDRANVEYWVNFQGIDTPEFRAYIGSIGLLDTLGNPKQGYDAYLRMLNLVCNQTSVGNSSSRNDLTIHPRQFKLFQNHPNPIDTFTHIKYSIHQPNHVSIKIFNVLGEHVDTIVDRFHSKGIFQMKWNTTGFPGGIYFCKLQVRDASETLKLILQ